MARVGQQTYLFATVTFTNTLITILLTHTATTAFLQNTRYRDDGELLRINSAISE